MFAGPFFEDRKDAGRRLAEAVRRHVEGEDVVVLALPRGGVPVGYEVARALGAPLDVIIVRKLGVPGQEELAMGAIASGGIRILNDDVVGMLGIGTEQIDRVAEREAAELERRERAYRGDRPPVEVRGRTVVLVDDGVATGSTIRAAIAALRNRGPARIIAAVPTAPAAACASLREEADEVVCLVSPDPFFAIGPSYANFEQLDDDEVRALLDDRRAEAA